MNLLVAAAGVILFALALAAYPAGLSPLYDASGGTVSVSVPKWLREKGYPDSILVSRDLIEGYFRGDYERFLNETFTPQGVYDPYAGRVIPPSEARGRVVGLRVEVNWVKLVLAVAGALLVVAAAVQTGLLVNGGKRGEPAGGYVP